MKNLNFNITLVLMFVFLAAHGQDSANFIKLKGQVDAYAGMNFANPAQFQTGARLLPLLSAGIKLKNNLKLDAEFSFDSYLNYHFTGWNNDYNDSRIKPYRLWLRLSSDRFELRAGLQKINFGSATLLRPLMWFDRMDPRDPLQLTDGVYALLGRYYFQNNANAWLWMLWGNDKTKGWEVIPSNSKIPEFGGRMQVPVPHGEAAVSYHHRSMDLTGLINPSSMHFSTNLPEDRLGLDAKWDLGVGLWAEYSLTHSTLDTGYFHPWTKLFNLGMDYTFGIGNGLNITTEFFRYSSSVNILGSALNNTLSLLSANYPFGTMNRVSAILYYNWSDNSWYRIINLQRQSDDWTFYLFLFWNPDKIAIFNTGNESNMFAGKGIQIMAVYNF
jgi:hypothetical protein